MPKASLVIREDHYPLSAAELWDLVGNTDHVNRLIGMPSVDFGPAQTEAQGLVRPATARMMGLRLDWEEHTFDWVREQRHSVLRVYRNGPIERIRMGVELVPAPGGCCLHQFAELTPRRAWPLARLISRQVTRRNMERLARFCREYARRLAVAPRPLAQPLPRPRPKAVHEAVLQRLQARVRTDWPADVTVLERLAALLREGSDAEVLHMRPYALARAWGLPRDAVLRAFLYATVTGLLELDWELMCPNCRVPKVGVSTFGNLSEHFHCDLCGTDYAADLDRTTELRFSVHPTVRAAVDAVYCIGGPQNTPHILVQQGLPPGESLALEATLPDEPLRVRLLRLNRTVILVPASDGAENVALELNAEDWVGGPLHFRPGPVRLAWHNAGMAPQVAVIEREQWDPDAATAARVMAFPEFRALFSAEVLQPGREIGIRNLCVLFTDLKDSTAMYERVGDAPAYGRVHRHFDFLTDCFRRHEGGIVKTIGDAVMASFPSTADALRGALEVQQRVDTFNAELGQGAVIVIKIGLHHGSAIAVNANGQMDYFGRTVNIAARIQGLSAGGDIVLAEALWAEPELQAVLAEHPCTVERFRAPLKGIAGETALVRLRPPTAQEGPPRPAPRLFRI